MYPAAKVTTSCSGLEHSLLKRQKKRFLSSGKNLMLHFLKLAPGHIFTLSAKKRGTYWKEGVESRRVLIFHLY